VKKLLWKVCMVAPALLVCQEAFCASGVKKAFVAFYVVALLVAGGVVVWWVKNRN